MAAPDTGVQRGSVGYMFEFPAIPTTPGIASLPSLPESKRILPDKSAQMPKIPITPLSYHDAWPILQPWPARLAARMAGRAWPFTYHVGPGPVRVKMHLKQDYQFRTLWDVIGRVRGSDSPGEWVIAGNHRDAWVYGAVDPNSGTAAMLEAAHGIGELLKSGWKPKRTMIFCQLDGEEEGLMVPRSGGAVRIRTGECAGLFQHGRGGFGAEVWCVGGAESEAIHTRRDQGRAQPERRDRLRSVAEGGSAGRSVNSIPDRSDRRWPPYAGRASQGRCSGGRPGQRLRL